MEASEVGKLMTDGRKYNQARKFLVEKGINFSHYSTTCWKERLSLKQAIGRILKDDFHFKTDDAIDFAQSFVNRWIQKG